MICGQCGLDMHGLRCECGWKAPALTAVKPGDRWHVRPCAHGDSMIRELVGQRGPALCRWCIEKQTVQPEPTDLPSFTSLPSRSA